jgi:hypothetical protein
MKNALNQFDEKELKKRISRLSSRAKAAFALSCASRMIEVYKALNAITGMGNPSALHRIQAEAWKQIQLTSSERETINRLLKQCDDLITEGRKVEEQLVPEERAVLATFSAIQCMDSNAAEDAVQAAEEAYQLVSDFVFDQKGISVIRTRETARSVDSDPVVAAELSRQSRDLMEIETADKKMDFQAVVVNLMKRSEEECKTFLPDPAHFVPHK